MTNSTKDHSVTQNFIRIKIHVQYPTLNYFSRFKIIAM